MENLLGQVFDDLIGDGWALPLNDQSDKFSHRCGQIILIVEQVDDLLVVGALHVHQLATILLHRLLEELEED